MPNHVPNFITAIDVGSAKTSVLVAELSENGLRYRGHGISESKGLRKGVITDLDKAASSIQKAVEKAEDSAGIAVEHGLVGVAGAHIRGVNSHGGITFGARAREIGRDDIRQAVDKARTMALPADREILHLLPQEFILDGQAGDGAVRLEQAQERKRPVEHTDVALGGDHDHGSATRHNRADQIALRAQPAQLVRQVETCNEPGALRRAGNHRPCAGGTADRQLLPQQSAQPCGELATDSSQRGRAPLDHQARDRRFAQPRPQLLDDLADQIRAAFCRGTEVYSWRCEFAGQGLPGGGGATAVY